MPALGSGINAALGRQDYSGIARGGEVMGQGMANAANIKMQGVMQLGQGIAQGIQGYRQKQQEKKEMEAATGAISRIASTTPSVAKALGLTPNSEGEYDPAELKAAVDGAGGPKGAIKFATMISQAAEQLQMQQAAQLTDQALKAQQIQLGRDELAARMQPKPQQGRVVSAAEHAALLESGQDIDSVPMQDGSYLVKSIGTYNSTPQTTINMGDNAAATERAKDIEARRAARGMKILEDAEAAMPGIEKLERGIDIIDNLDPNTGVFQPVTQLRDKVLAAFGNKNAMEQASATELLNAMQGSQVFELFSDLGLGARGLDTPAERDFMLDVLSGRVTMTPKSIKSLLTELRDRKISAVEKHNSRAKDNEEYREFIKKRNFGEVPVFEFKKEFNETESTDLGGGFILN